LWYSKRYLGLVGQILLAQILLPEQISEKFPLISVVTFIYTILIPVKHRVEVSLLMVILICVALG